MEVTREIEKMEKYSDDEFDIYENQIVIKAYANAKKKITQKMIKEKKMREGIAPMLKKE